MVRAFPIIIIWALLLMAAPVSAQDEQGSLSMFSQAELDQMLAPIALYPDALLAQVLMASTYPVEVVTADSWVKQNRDLQRDRLNDVLDEQNWDASVKALVPFPDILSMMSARLEWTQMVGDAFLAQESDVMDTVQRLRRKAYDADNLRSSEQEQVSFEDGAIRIEPTDPETVYVPAYDPTWVYGPWWWPGYPPYVIYPYWPGVVVAPGFITFGIGCSVGASWGHVWGNWDWRHRRVFVNENRNININRRNIDASRLRTTPWVHSSVHRRGAPYLGPAVRERFRQVTPGAVENRRPFRGFDRTPGPPAGGPETRSGLAPGVPGDVPRRPEKRPAGMPGISSGVPSGPEKRPAETPGVSGGATGGPERRSGAASGIAGSGTERLETRTGRPGALPAPERGAGRTVAPGAIVPPAAHPEAVSRPPAPPASRPVSTAERNPDAFRGIGQGDEVRRQSSWGATVRPSAPAEVQAPAGIPGAGPAGVGGVQHGGGSGEVTRGGAGGAGPRGGRR